MIVHFDVVYHPFDVRQKGLIAFVHQTVDLLLDDAQIDPFSHRSIGSGVIDGHELK